MFQRAHLQTLINRLNEPKRFIQVVQGPRQVGKTTLVVQLLQKISIPHLFVSADAIAASDIIWLRQQWEIARIKFREAGIGRFLLVVDEIQKIENWSETVKLLWDEDSRNEMSISIILLGSSRMLLQKGLTESLAGRFETIYMGHWSLQEMQSAFGWTPEQYVWFGGYPGSATLIQDEMRWKNYVLTSLIETSVSKDIMMTTRIDKPALMKKLFELGCLYSGQIVSYTKLLGQLQDAGNTTTLSHYLNLLNTAGLLCGIEKYAGTVLRKRASIPKFQVHNTALISCQRNEIFSEIQLQPKEWGRMVESAIGAHLLNHSLNKSYTVNYWREGNDEVDFVLESNNKLIAIEVKTSAASTTKGMQSFNHQYHPDKMVLIDHIALTWKEFLKIDPITLL
jgi:uncharacterized protein